MAGPSPGGRVGSPLPPLPRAVRQVERSDLNNNTTNQYATWLCGGRVLSPQPQRAHACITQSPSPNLNCIESVLGCRWPALSPGCVAAATFRVQGLRGSSTRVTCISAMQRLVSHCRVSCPCMQQCVDWPGSCGQFRPLSVRASHDDPGCEFPARWACQPTRADRFVLPSLSVGVVPSWAPPTLPLRLCPFLWTARVHPHGHGLDAGSLTRELRSHPTMAR